MIGRIPFEKAVKDHILLVPDLKVGVKMVLCEELKYGLAAQPKILAFRDCLQNRWLLGKRPA